MSTTSTHDQPRWLPKLQLIVLEERPLLLGGRPRVMADTADAGVISIAGGGRATVPAAATEKNEFVSYEKAGGERSAIEGTRNDLPPSTVTANAAYAAVSRLTGGGRAAVPTLTTVKTMPSVI
jgi:hypothetical protein